MDSEQLEKRRQAFRLQEELLKRPELARIQQIDRLTDSFTIFGKNYSDLKQLLTLITLQPEGLELFEQDNVQAENRHCARSRVFAQLRCCSNINCRPRKSASQKVARENQ